MNTWQERIRAMHEKKRKAGFLFPMPERFTDAEIADLADTCGAPLPEELLEYFRTPGIFGRLGVDDEVELEDEGGELLATFRIPTPFYLLPEAVDLFNLDKTHKWSLPPRCVLSRDSIGFIVYEFATKSIVLIRDTSGKRTELESGLDAFMTRVADGLADLGY